MEVKILEEEVTEIKEVNGKRKERASGKHLILKGTPVASTEAVHKAIADAERATKEKQKNKGKQPNRQTVVSEEEEESSLDDETDDLESLEHEMLECIEVVM